VTMRYPSDNEDGGVDHIGGGDMVTMRYPSDNEDGGVDHIGGGELGGPSNRPQPFLSRDGLKLERDINKSAYHGHTRMADRIDELGQAIASRPDAATEREHRMLSAFYGGFDAIEAAIAEIDGLRQRALLDPPQLGRLSDDRLLLVGLRSDIERYNDALTRLAAGSSTEDTIAAGIFKKAFHGGDELRKRAAEIDDLLPRARLTHEAFRALVVERACIEVFGGGQPGIAERMGQIEQQLNDPELSTEGRETVSLEYGVYKRLQEGLTPFIDRVVALDATLTAMGTP